MTFNIECYIECSRCKSAYTNYEDGFAPEDFEDFKPNEFEDAAIDWFKNHEWTRVGVTDAWLCPSCN